MIFTDFIKLEISTVDLSASISRSIIDDYNFVIGVVLGEDRIQVVLYSEFGIIIVSWHYNTHRQLFSDFGELKFILDSFPFVVKVILGNFCIGLIKDHVVLGQK
jgi:hypothetical protein